MNGPLKWHGGKHYLASRIVALMPKHTHYVEPYGGGLSVLLAKACEGISEVANDLHQDLTNFWRVLQEDRAFAQFQRRVQAIPFSETEWQNAGRLLDRLPADEKLERAVQFFVHCRQSMAGRCRDFAPLTRNRVRRGINEQASAWLGAVEGLAAVHARLKRVAILNRPAMEVIHSQDGPQTLTYLDPPYLPSTRTSPDTYGALEMTEDQHIELLEAVLTLQGKVMLSGYHCPLYDRQLSKWEVHEFELPNNAAGGTRKRRMTEVLWCNFEVQRHSRKEVANAVGR